MSPRDVPAPIGVIQRNTRSALNMLGLPGDSVVQRLREWVAGERQLQKRWQRAHVRESVVGSEVAERFPRSPWPGFYVLRFGASLDRIPDGDVEVLRGDPDRNGIVFEDRSVLSWSQVLWVDSENQGPALRIVEQSMNYQRPGGARPDWVCQYHYEPVDHDGNQRDDVSRPVHHLHMGPRGESREHFPLRPLSAFTMLRWLVHTFPECVLAGKEREFDQKADHLLNLLTPDAPPICAEPPFPPGEP